MDSRDLLQVVMEWLTEGTCRPDLAQKFVAIGLTPETIQNFNDQELGDAFGLNKFLGTPQALFSSPIKLTVAGSYDNEREEFKRTVFYHPQTAGLKNRGAYQEVAVSISMSDDFSIDALAVPYDHLHARPSTPLNPLEVGSVLLSEDLAGYFTGLLWWSRALSKQTLCEIQVFLPNAAGSVTYRIEAVFPSRAYDDGSGADPVGEEGPCCWVPPSGSAEAGYTATCRIGRRDIPGVKILSLNSERVLLPKTSTSPSTNMAAISIDLLRYVQDAYANASLKKVPQKELVSKTIDMAARGGTYPWHLEGTRNNATAKEGGDTETPWITLPPQLSGLQTQAVKVFAMGVTSDSAFSSASNANSSHVVAGASIQVRQLPPVRAAVALGLAGRVNSVGLSRSAATSLGLLSPLMHQMILPPANDVMGNPLTGWGASRVYLTSAAASPNSVVSTVFPALDYPYVKDIEICVLNCGQVEESVVLESLYADGRKVVTVGDILRTSRTGGYAAVSAIALSTGELLQRPGPRCLCSKSGFLPFGTDKQLPGVRITRKAPCCGCDLESHATKVEFLPLLASRGFDEISLRFCAHSALALLELPSCKQDEVLEFDIEWFPTEDQPQGVGAEATVTAFPSIQNALAVAISRGSAPTQFLSVGEPLRVRMTAADSLVARHVFVFRSVRYSKLRSLSISLRLRCVNGIENTSTVPAALSGSLGPEVTTNRLRSLRSFLVMSLGHAPHLRPEANGTSSEVFLLSDIAKAAPLIKAGCTILLVMGFPQSGKAMFINLLRGELILPMGNISAMINYLGGPTSGETQDGVTTLQDLRPNTAGGGGEAPDVEGTTPVSANRIWCCWVAHRSILCIRVPSLMAEVKSAHNSRVLRDVVSRLETILLPSPSPGAAIPGGTTSLAPAKVGFALVAQNPAAMNTLTQIMDGWVLDSSSTPPSPLRGSRMFSNAVVSLVFSRATAESKATGWNYRRLANPEVALEEKLSDICAAAERGGGVAAVKAIIKALHPFISELTASKRSSGGAHECLEAIDSAHFNAFLPIHHRRAMGSISSSPQAVQGGELFFDFENTTGDSEETAKLRLERVPLKTVSLTPDELRLDLQPPIPLRVPEAQENPEDRLRMGPQNEGADEDSDGIELCDVRDKKAFLAGRARRGFNGATSSSNPKAEAIAQQILGHRIPHGGNATIDTRHSKKVLVQIERSNMNATEVGKSFEGDGWVLKRRGEK